MGSTGPAHAVSATVSSTRYRYQAGVGLGPAGLLNRYGAFLPLIGLAAAAGGLWAAQVARRRRLALDAPQTQLRQAMARGEIEGHLQPIIDLATGECAGAEMLMRWRHPEHGLLPPARFLREAQASGLLWQMTQGCFRDIAASLDSCETLPEGFMLCVNFGSTELALDGDSDRFAALARPGGRRWYTVIELPERDAREPAMAARLTALQDMGFLIALDDFGTAHSGTRWLERLSVDLVKIDMSIVSTIGTDSVTRPVLDAIIALARDTGVKLIAEGVEHPHQTSHLRRQGVAYGQGYVFSAPVPAAAFIERWLGIEESDEDPSLPSVARRSPVPDQIAQQAPHQTPH
jgi:sensor c-di-GMP phosphodiesterase-like protein